MNILTNIKVYDLEESIIASGYPMRTAAEMRDVTEGDLKRAFNLTKASKENHAHGQFLTGIRVNFDLRFSNKAWVEAERYRFLEFVSSQSTMHRIAKFNLMEQFNSYVDPEIIRIVQEKVTIYNSLNDAKEYWTLDRMTQDEIDSANQELKEAYLKILYNVPAGFELTARMTTNYRCILNIINQRWNHRLPEWRQACKEFLDLPYMEDFVKLYAPNVDIEQLKNND